MRIPLLGSRSDKYQMEHCSGAYCAVTYTVELQLNPVLSVD